MEEYYRRRARVFDEELYKGRDFVRQKELQRIANVSKEALKARRVLDVACGTAYWTEIVSETAQSIVGTDFAEEMLKIAEGRNSNVQFLSVKQTCFACRLGSARERIVGNALYLFTSSQSPIALPSVSFTTAKNAMSNMGPFGVTS